MRLHRLAAPGLMLAALAACSGPGETALREGNRAAARGDFAAAASAFERAASALPDQARPRALLGNAHWAAGQREAAAAAWGQAQRLDPGSADAHLGLARVELKAGRIADALAHLDAVGPARTDALSLRAVALLARGDAGDAGLALATAQKALATAPDDASALYAAGCAALSGKDGAAAQRHFDRLLARHPDSALGAYGLARLAAVRGQKTDVLLYLRAARKAHPAPWDAAAVLTDPAFLFLEGDAELAREIGPP